MIKTNFPCDNKYKKYKTISANAYNYLSITNLFIVNETIINVIVNFNINILPNLNLMSSFDCHFWSSPVCVCIQISSNSWKPCSIEILILRFRKNLVPGRYHLACRAEKRKCLNLVYHVCSYSNAWFTMQIGLAQNIADADKNKIFIEKTRN